MNDIAGTERDADIDVPDIQESREFSDKKSGRDFCNRLFSVYGDRKADLRGTLGDGYNWFHIIKCGTLYAVPVSCNVHRQGKESRQEQRWSLMKNYRN